jgi:hypothetical protein
MSAGILPATPVAVPIAIGGAVVGGGYLVYYLTRLRRKLAAVKDGDEVQFSEKEAKVIEAIIRRIATKKPAQ